MLKRLLAGALALSVTLSSASMTAVSAYTQKNTANLDDAAANDCKYFAEETVSADITVDDDAQIYEDFVYAESLDGTLYVTKYIGQGGDVVIPNEIDGIAVTMIGFYTFSGCDNVTSITIPDNVNSLGAPPIDQNRPLAYVERPFADCPSLAAINVSEGNRVYSSIDGVLYSKDASVLLYCPQGKEGEYDIPEGVTEIGRSAFDGCANLTSVIMPDSITEVDYYAFYRCSSLKSVRISKGIDTIRSMTFTYCSSLVFVEIPDGVTSIESSAFTSCSSLEGVVIPDSVTSIASYSFGGNAKGFTVYGYTGSAAEEFAGSRGTSFVALDEMNVEDFSYKELSDGTLSITDYNGVGSDVIIPPSIDGRTVTSVGSIAFLNNRTVTSVYIIGAVSSIGNRTFYGCTSLEEVKLGGSLNTIGEAAFSRSGLRRLDLPDSVTYIGSSAFAECSALEKISLPESVTSISDSMFAHCTALSSAALPDTVTAIGKKAFFGCSSLTEAIIPLNVGAIGDSAFEGCPTELIIFGYTNTSAEVYAKENGITFIPFSDFDFTLRSDGTFSVTGYSGSASHVYVPSHVNGTVVTEIADKAFYNCDPITSISIPDGIVYIGSDAFAYCKNLTEVKISDSVTLIGNSAFFSCSSLSSLEIGKGVLQIEAMAFNNCYSLTDLIIPDSVALIGDYAFDSCTSLTYLVIGSGVAEIGYGAFHNCRSLVHLDIPGNVERIGEWAFYACPSLKTVTISGGVTDIGVGAFSGCTSLEAAVIPASVTEIGEGAFDDCSSDIVIYGRSDSYAEAYAMENEISFVPISGFTDEETGIQIMVDADAIPDNTRFTAELTDRDDGSLSFVMALSRRGMEVKPSGDITVRIPIPPELSGEKIFVYRVEDDEGYTDMKAYISGNYAVFTTDRLGEYILTPERLVRVIGDVNGNGEVDDIDVIELARYLAGWDVDIDVISADVNGDETVDDLDVIMLARRLAGWNV